MADRKDQVPKVVVVDMLPDGTPTPAHVDERSWINVRDELGVMRIPSSFDFGKRLRATALQQAIPPAESNEVVSLTDVPGLLDEVYDRIQALMDAVNT